MIWHPFNWFKFKPPLDGKVSLDELRRRFRRVNLLSSLLVPVVAIVFGFICWWLLIQISEFASMEAAGDVYFYRMPKKVLAFPAICWGLILADFAISFGLRLYYGEQGYQEFRLYDEWTTGLRRAPLRATVYPLILAITLPVAVLSIDCWLRVKQSRIEYNPFVGMGGVRAYPVTQIASMIDHQASQTPAGKIVRNPKSVVIMNDGFEFRLDFFEPSVSKQREILHYLAKQSGMKVKVIDPQSERENHGF